MVDSKTSTTEVVVNDESFTLITDAKEGDVFRHVDGSLWMFVRIGYNKFDLIGLTEDIGNRYYDDKTGREDTMETMNEDRVWNRVDCKITIDLKWVL